MNPENHGTYFLKNKATGKVLIGRTGLDTVSVYTIEGGPPLTDLERWTLETTSDGYWHLTHPESGYRLDSNAEKSIYLHDANDGSYQKWILTPDVEDYWTLKNLATGFMADSNVEGHAYTNEMNDGAYQRWRFLDAA